MLVVRLNQLATGGSGVDPEILLALQRMIVADALPDVRTLGSIGTGDLSALATTALALMGELPTSRPLAEPVRFGAADGLAFISSNAGVLGDAALAVSSLVESARAAVMIAALTFDAVDGNSEAYSDAVLRVTPFPGAASVGSNLRLILGADRWGIRRDGAGAVLAASRIQDPFGLRAIPQVHGPVLDALSSADQRYRCPGERSRRESAPVGRRRRARRWGSGASRRLPLRLSPDGLGFAGPGRGAERAVGDVPVGHADRARLHPSGAVPRGRHAGGVRGDGVRVRGRFGSRSDQGGRGARRAADRRPLPRRRGRCQFRVVGRAAVPDHCRALPGTAGLRAGGRSAGPPDAAAAEPSRPGRRCPRAVFDAPRGPRRSGSVRRPPHRGRPAAGTGRAAPGYVRGMTERRRRPTLKDIAEETGLSQAAVSYGLRGLQVPIETQERVREAAERLGYQVDPIARALASGRTGNVGLLCGSLEDIWQQGVAAALGRGLLGAGRQALIVDATNDPELERKLAAQLVDQRVDALITMPIDPRADHWTGVAQRVVLVSIGDGAARGRDCGRSGVRQRGRRHGRAARVGRRRAPPGHRAHVDGREHPGPAGRSRGASGRSGAGRGCGPADRPARPGRGHRGGDPHADRPGSADSGAVSVRLARVRGLRRRTRAGPRAAG